ncbi:MAG: ribosome biogenesis GTPase Der [Hyphomicrobiales bacterium]
MGNIVAIVGRPNVGKSTFFNRLTQSRDAIVEETSGVTRDRHYGQTEWNGSKFSVIDTGGYVIGSDDVFEEEIRKQVALAIDEADAIIFLVDAIDGLTDMDKDVADLLRRTKKNVYLVANKVDTPIKIADASEFYSLGLGNVYTVSAINGGGTGEILDDLVKNLPEVPEELPDSDIPRLAFVGKPNVGKSSLINALMGIDRNIVTPIAGTTRDTIYTRFNAFGFDLQLVDTAGLRKKGKIYENIEFYSTLRSVRAIENADIALLLIEANEGLQAQDLNIVHLIQKNNKGLVIIVNKWDLIEKETNTHLEFEDQIREKIAPFSDVPIIFTSVINKQRIHKALEKAVEVFSNRTRKITTSKLNEYLLDVIEQTPPPTASRGRYVRIKYITQLKTHYPSFVFFCNRPQDVKDSYKRFLEKKIREKWDFSGVPVKMYFREK